MSNSIYLNPIPRLTIDHCGRTEWVDMRIGCLQINPTIGAFSSNRAALLDGYGKAVDDGAELVVAPELSVCGYPPRDLLFYDDFISANEWSEQKLVRETGPVPLIFGSLTRRQEATGKPFFNSACLAVNGRVQERIHKTLIPTYDVFDEDRYFESNPNIRTVSSLGRTLGLTVCEDIWNDSDFWSRRLYDEDPVERLVALGAEIIINLSASPWSLSKEKTRLKMLQTTATRHRVPVLQVNAVGGNDELLFDGNSLLVSAAGTLVRKGAAFREEVFVCDSEEEATASAAFDSDESLLWKGLCLGTRDYVEKCGCRDVVLGLSGGIDSAVTAAIATDALGPERVLGVCMPSPYSSQGSIDDSLELASNLGIETRIIPIAEPFESLTSLLAPVFREKEPDVTEENIQARLRGLILMAISNKFKRFVLTTGNKSELAAGFCTLYGDMCGALSVINDVPKTWVYRIARYRQELGASIPESTLTKAPSAELRPEQLDQDSLPPYDVLDHILENYVVQNRSIDEMVSGGLEMELVRDLVRKVDVNEFKRRQAAPGLRVTSKAFGTGRRIPIAQAFRHLPSDEMATQV